MVKVPRVPPEGAGTVVGAFSVVMVDSNNSVAVVPGTGAWPWTTAVPRTANRDNAMDFMVAIGVGVVESGRMRLPGEHVG